MGRHAGRSMRRTRCRTARAMPKDRSTPTPTSPIRAARKRSTIRGSTTARTATCRTIVGISSSCAAPTPSASTGSSARRCHVQSGRPISARGDGNPFDGHSLRELLRLQRDAPASGNLHERGSEGRTPWLYDLGANVTYRHSFEVADLQIKLSVYNLLNQEREHRGRRLPVLRAERQPRLENRHRLSGCRAMRS